MDNKSWIVKIISITASIVVIIIILKILGVIGKEPPVESDTSLYLRLTTPKSGICPHSFSDIGGGYCRDINGTVVPKR